MGSPHCTRSLPHVRQISTQRLPSTAQEAGSVRRPVFSVMSASFRPLPSPQRRFSFGTRTPWKRMTPFSIAFRPMKWQRSPISTPGHAFSTMKAEIFFVSGCRAITTKRLATVPLVHQSFSPSRM